MNHSQSNQAIKARYLSLAYANRRIIDNFNIDIPSQKITVILGANGCGKSTLLKGLCGLLTPLSGTVCLNEQDIHALPRKKLAQKIAILTQNTQVNSEMIVEDLVALGRHPHHKFLRSISDEDKRCIKQALEYTKLSELVDKRIATLSGGQQQRVWIAMTLAQNTPWLFLDEPTTYLDLNHQISILNLLKALNSDNKLSLVMVLHDINLACRYADNIILMKHGALYAQGAPKDIITNSSIKHTFDLDCDIIDDPISHTPLCIPHLINH